MNTFTALKGIVIFAVTFGCFALAKPAKESQITAVTSTTQQPATLVPQSNDQPVTQPTAGPVSDANNPNPDGASTTSTAGAASTGDNAELDTANSLRSFFDRWIAAKLQNDPTTLVTFYADEVSEYYGRENVTKASLENAQKTAIDVAAVSRLSLTDRHFQRTPSGALMVTCTQDITEQTAQGAVHTETPLEFVLVSEGGDWKITSEEEGD